ncbi:hypothetical protein Y032_0149g2709 [Ancylostoma ceylanicum]|uniref:Uncharacterized protein n=1 Tax=Ancylostoma ceylanicum TaxID=53326 RepID=A0A016T1N6_9BILA|nr:hypothetical protein Y032_0149g2709 [Ancylostoma ceylanicum]
MAHRLLVMLYDQDHFIPCNELSCRRRRRVAYTAPGLRCRPSAKRLLSLRESVLPICGFKQRKARILQRIHTIKMT